jgi:hypothetical protein
MSSCLHLLGVMNKNLDQKNGFIPLSLHDFTLHHLL